MTEGDYNKAMDLLKEVERNIVRGEYDYAHINIIEALILLDQEEEHKYED